MLGRTSSWGDCFQRGLLYLCITLLQKIPPVATASREGFTVFAHKVKLQNFPLEVNASSSRAGFTVFAPWVIAEIPPEGTASREGFSIMLNCRTSPDGSASSSRAGFTVFAHKVTAELPPEESTPMKVVLYLYLMSLQNSSPVAGVTVFVQKVTAELPPEGSACREGFTVRFP